MRSPIAIAMRARVDRLASTVHGRCALMGLLGWVMMGLAIWHFTIFLPDRFWGGIVGAFVGSLLGAIVIAHRDLQRQSLGSADPGEKATDIAVVLYAVPGR